MIANHCLSDSPAACEAQQGMLHAMDEVPLHIHLPPEPARPYSTSKCPRMCNGMAAVQA